MKSSKPDCGLGPEKAVIARIASAPMIHSAGGGVRERVSKPMAIPLSAKTRDDEAHGKVGRYRAQLPQRDLVQRVISHR